MRLRDPLASLSNDEGVSAIEFALILPFMIAMYTGAMELSALMMADRKATNLAATAADLVAQDNVVTNAEMDDVFAATTAILAPLNPQNATIIVSSVIADAGGNTSIAWSDGFNIAGRAPGSQMPNLPAGLVAPGGSVIVAEITFTYQSLTGQFLNGADFAVEDRFYMRPRRTAQIQRVAN